MSEQQANNPLHGIKLEQIVTQLAEHYGWEELGSRIEVRCFNYDPSVKSSLKFLRRTPWAREKVEDLYLRMQGIKPPPRIHRDVRNEESRAPRKEALKKPRPEPIPEPPGGFFVKRPKGPAS